MKSTYFNSSIALSPAEKAAGRASYARVIRMYADNIVLANNIAELDPSVYENITVDNAEQLGKVNEKIEDLRERLEETEDEETAAELENEIEILQEQAEELETAAYNAEIYQWYLCNLSEYERAELLERGVILSYSDMLGLDVIAVDHYGTAWDYVLTASELDGVQETA